MVSLRLSEEEEKKLTQISRAENTTKTAILKAALQLYFQQYEQSQSPFELGADLFGLGGSGDGSLAKNYKQKLKTKLREKHTH